MNNACFNAIKTRIALLVVTLAIIAGVSEIFAQSKRNRATKEFMREKLELSQHVLEGIATEDYDLISAKGTRLSAMSQQAGWRVFDNPDYEQQSVAFRRHVNSLVKAAKDKNLDAATLAYVRVTMSCVDCHKLVRGKLVASAAGLQAATVAADLDTLPHCHLERNGAQLPKAAQSALLQESMLAMKMNE